MPTEEQKNDVAKIKFLLGGKVIAYHANLGHVLGSAKAGILASQLLFWSQQDIVDEEGWFYRTQDKLREETALSRAELDSARKQLRSFGILEEKRCGEHGKLHYRMNWIILGLLLDAAVKKRCEEKGIVRANVIAENPQTSVSESRKHDCGKPANFIKKNQLKEDIKISLKTSGHNAVRKALEEEFIKVTGLSPPTGTTAKAQKAAGTLWWQPLREIAVLTNWNQNQGVSLIRVSVKRMREGKLTISDPNSILKVARAIMGEVNSGLTTLDTRSRDEKIQAESDYYEKKRRRRINAQDMARQMEDDGEGQGRTD